MEMKDDELKQKNTRPACFGDEAKFVAYMENQAADSECARCPVRMIVGNISSLNAPVRPCSESIGSPLPLNPSSKDKLRTGIPK